MSSNKKLDVLEISGDDLNPEDITDVTQKLEI